MTFKKAFLFSSREPRLDIFYNFLFCKYMFIRKKSNTKKENQKEESKDRKKLL